MSKDIEMGEHTLCSRSSKCLLLHRNGIFLGSGNIPQTTRDHTWPQSTQENIGQEGLRTGQCQAFCFSQSCGNSPCSSLYSCLYSCPVFSLLSSSSDSSGARDGVSYWAGKGVPPGLEATCPIGAKSSCSNPVHNFQCPHRGHAQLQESPNSSSKCGLSPGIKSFSPSRWNLPVRDHFNHEQFCLRNIADMIILLDFQGNRA